LSELLGNPNPRFHAQGWMVLAVALAPVVWLVLPAVRKSGLGGRASAAL
jgi:hypothetical protein